MTKIKKIHQIAVIGGTDPDVETAKLAIEVGRLVASFGAVLVCGGLGGIMETSARGAKEGGGLTIGILPNYDKQSANRYIDVIIPTGMGHARNVIVAASGDLVIALAGAHGTRSEISIALQLKIPVIGVNAWDDISGVHQVTGIIELRQALMPFF